MERMVIVAYRPKPGKADALRALVRDHVPRLRAEGLVGEGPALAMEAADGSIVEVFAWRSAEAVEAAHDNAAVQAMWDEFNAVCDYVPVGALPEASKMFSEFAPLAR